MFSKNCMLWKNFHTLPNSDPPPLFCSLEKKASELRTESILTVPVTAKHRAAEKLNHGSHHYVRSSSMFYVHSFM